MNTNQVSFSHSPLIANYMPRPRVDKIFDQVTRGKLVYVIAGAGYGKTQAVHHYVEGQADAVIRWMQLTDSDNLGSRYWENLTHGISHDNPNLASKLRELGFPKTLSQFKRFAEIVKSAEHRARKTFLVLDDFHLIHSEEALIFAERCARLQIPGACVIIISRTEPTINTLSLFSSGKAGRITEDELRFSESEIADCLEQRGVNLPAKDISQVAQETKGWALAIKLLSLALQRKYSRLDFALDTMKQSIFKLFATEAWDDLSEDVQKELVRVSLTPNLPIVLPHEGSTDNSWIQDTPQLASFVWFDSFSGDYRIHPLYLEFLQEKWDILSDDEKQNIYQQAARWCSENDYYMDAVGYFAKSRQFESMIQTLFSYPFRLPYDAIEYYLKILEELDPSDEEQHDPSVLFLKNFFTPLFLIGVGRYDEAREQSFADIHQWEHSDNPLADVLLYIAYSNLAYLSIYTSTVTHQYDSAKYLRKSVEHHKRSAIPPAKISRAFLNASIRSYACLVGEGADLSEFDRFLEASRQTALYVDQTAYSVYAGYDDLVACEIAFFKNQNDIARSYANKAIIKARAKCQYDIEAMAEQYLLRMAVHEGDYPLVKEILKHLRSHLSNPDFWERQLLYDLFVGSVYAQIGLPGLVPKWYTVDEKEAVTEGYIPTRELVVSVRYYIAAKKFNQALAVLSKSTPREPQERFLLGELILTLLLAVVKNKTGDTAGAIADFQKAYRMSYGGVFEKAFIELGRNLHPLIVATLQQKDHGIPEEWLKTIDRRASVYAKKADVIRSSIKREQNIPDAIQLSDREQKILSDLYHGLSREEIATNQYISVGTVKKALESMYAKLGANSIADAIRIALENKLIE